MNESIYIAGAGQTPFGEHWDKSIRNLMEDAIETAIEDAPCTVLDIDTIIVGNMLAECTNNQAHLGALASSLLPHHPPALRTEAACASGAVALHTACALLESDRAETILVLGVEKMTDVSTDAINAALMAAGDSELDKPSGLTFAGIFGLIAQRYMHEYGLTRDQMSLISALHHQNAQTNPFAQFQNAITPDAVSQSPMVADPLRLLDCSPVSDGAAAVILSTKYESPLSIAASSLQNDKLSLAERESLTSFRATEHAMHDALEDADIKRDDISCIELHDCFSIASVIHLEDMGYAPPGRGIRFYEGESDLTINKSGGLKACGHPVGATGVKQIIDVAKELQSSSNRFGLAHNIGGIGATACIHIIEYFDT